jgi:hypothetical protein
VRGGRSEPEHNQREYWEDHFDIDRTNGAMKPCGTRNIVAAGMNFDGRCAGFLVEADPRAQKNLPPAPIFSAPGGWVSMNLNGSVDALFRPRMLRQVFTTKIDSTHPLGS